MPKKYKIISSIISVLIMFLFFSIYFSNNLKKEILQSNLKNDLNYKVIKLNNNFNKIIIEKNEGLDEKTYFNKFAKDEFKTTTLLITTKDCKSDYIHLIARYNKKSYSDIYKLKPASDQLYINIHNSKNNLNFLFFEIHKNNSSCIEKIYQLLDKKLPFTYYIVTKKDDAKFTSKTKKYQLDKNGLKILKKDKDLIIEENKITLHKNYGNDNDKYSNISQLNKYYYKDILKPHYLIKDVLLAKIDSKKTKNLVIKCKVITGNINFLIFDSKNFEIINFQKCKNNKKNLLTFPPRENLKLLISSQALNMSTYETNFKINFYYF